MNKIKQFRALLRFQAPVNPAIAFMPLALGMPYLLPFIISSQRHYHPGLQSLLSNQNIWLVGLVGVMILAPEVLRSTTTNVIWATGTEFLLTRAVDRHLVLRARSAFFYLIILAIPLAAFLFALKNPDIQINEYSKYSQHQVLERLPGSVLMPAGAGDYAKTITIPYGNLLVEGWRLWLFLCTALGSQMLIFLIYPLKYRRFILWGTYIGIVFLPLLMLHGSISANDESLPFNEKVFFVFAANQLLLWLVTILALIIGQLWCEHRFVRMEQS